MIDFLYVIIIILYITLAIGVYIKEWVLGAFAGMGLMVVGVYLIINGIVDVSEFLTYGFGIINLCLGAYVFILGSLEQIETF